jgi:hypothetical protein
LKKLGRPSVGLDHSDSPYAAGTGYTDSRYAVGWPDEDYYAVDGGRLTAAASSGPADQAASPDGYGYVETNEYFECEDGVREMAF